MLLGHRVCSVVGVSDSDALTVLFVWWVRWLRSWTLIGIFAAETA